jgi:sialic acid synthase SpsE
MQDQKIVFSLRLDCVNLSACFVTGFSEAVVYYLLILYISQGEQSECLTAGIAQHCTLKKQLSQVSELNLSSMILLHLCINCYKLMHMV